jgi:hypothetical protein
MKMKEELPMKLLDDPKIPTTKQKCRKPDHSHKPLDVVEAGKTLLHEAPPPPPERCLYRP